MGVLEKSFYIKYIPRCTQVSQGSSGSALAPSVFSSARYISPPEFTIGANDTFLTGRQKAVTESVREVTEPQITETSLAPERLRPIEFPSCDYLIQILDSPISK
ncbi:hypothetical protein BOTCAL_0009g00480 [Botryotinia calthae]|uniref:Uncharacterized protein n=1 Tax=Botryotinia calthae TaxID=38488 RepID=A0A4Y8DIV6_9HELO|nr:hypothetical protein BOTCAL_0009g00480 [Botryotinia calthae]